MHEVPELVISLVVLPVYLGMCFLLACVFVTGFARKLMVTALFLVAPAIVAHSYQLFPDYSDFKHSCAGNDRKNILEKLPVENIYGGNYAAPEYCAWDFFLLTQYKGLECGISSDINTFPDQYYRFTPRPEWTNEKAEHCLSITGGLTEEVRDCWATIVSGRKIDGPSYTYNIVTNNSTSQRHVRSQTQILKDGKPMAVADNHSYYPFGQNPPSLFKYVSYAFWPADTAKMRLRFAEAYRCFCAEYLKISAGCRIPGSSQSTIDRALSTDGRSAGQRCRCVEFHC
jgi:hypothetical protein